MDKQKKPTSKAQKAKLAAALKKWRDNLTPEDKAAMANKAKARWEAMKPKDRTAALAGMKAWQKEQKAAKAARKPAPKARPRAKATKAATFIEVSESGIPKRTRKAAAK